MKKILSKLLKSSHSPWVILPLLVIAAITGAMISVDTTVFHINLYFLFDLIGTLFLNAIMLIVVPLIGFSLISGLLRTGKEENRKRLWGKTFGIFIFNNSLALILAFLLFLIFKEPFINTAKSLHELALQTSTLEEIVPNAQGVNLKHIFEQMIPTNLVEILSGSKMLGLIIFSLLLGYGITLIAGPAFMILKSFFEGIFHAFINVTKFIMKFLPLAVFCLVAKQFTLTGFESIKPLLFFTMVVILGLLIFSFIVLPLVLKSFTRLSITNYYKTAFDGAITAFSTTSSIAALPIALESVHEKGKISEKICNLVLPLGTSLNMAGSALFAYFGAIFVASAYFYTIDIPMGIFLIFFSLIASMGVAAVPSACLFVVVILLKGLGLPGEGIAVILAVDRILDMFRAGTNMLTNTCSCVIVAKSEGEKNILS